MAEKFSLTLLFSRGTHKSPKSFSGALIKGEVKLYA